MNEPYFTLQPCISFCLSGDDQDPCAQHAEPDLLDYLEEQIMERNISASVCPSGCAECCSSGPLITVGPGGQRYEQLFDHSAVDIFLDHLEQLASAPA